MSSLVTASCPSGAARCSSVCPTPTIGAAAGGILAMSVLSASVQGGIRWQRPPPLLSQTVTLTGRDWGIGERPFAHLLLPPIVAPTASNTTLNPSALAVRKSSTVLTRSLLTQSWRKGVVRRRRWWRRRQDEAGHHRHGCTSACSDIGATRKGTSVGSHWIRVAIEQPREGNRIQLWVPAADDANAHVLRESVREATR